MADRLTVPVPVLLIDTPANDAMPPDTAVDPPPVNVPEPGLVWIANDTVVVLSPVTRLLNASSTRTVIAGLLGFDGVIEHTRDAVELGQDQVVVITSSGVEITDAAGQPVEGKAYHINWDASAAEKGGYDCFMLKEIAEQPEVVSHTLAEYIDFANRQVRIPEKMAIDFANLEIGRAHI